MNTAILCEWTSFRFAGNATFIDSLREWTFRGFDTEANRFAEGLAILHVNSTRTEMARWFPFVDVSLVMPSASAVRTP